ncbi:hypothetical protein K9L67_06190 [Candidatus Woesearchaeota archaeon]|nr:hypothetical protein [Candidatus Woesearchaeota archaeon]MCF7901782.1 hypothetical protein [Candidatus Woesearchaeota archaeon]
MKIQKFNTFEKKEELKPLADGILALEENEDGEFIPIKGAVEIEAIIDIIKDESIINKIEENITVDTAISVGEVKRGQIIYLTAMLKRAHQTTPFNQTTMGVLKVRIVDFYYGLNKLKQVMKNK